MHSSSRWPTSFSKLFIISECPKLNSAHTSSWWHNSRENEEAYCNIQTRERVWHSTEPQLHRPLPLSTFPFPSTVTYSRNKATVVGTNVVPQERDENSREQIPSWHPLHCYCAFSGDKSEYFSEEFLTWEQVHGDAILPTSPYRNVSLWRLQSPRSLS